MKIRWITELLCKHNWYVSDCCISGITFRHCTKCGKHQRQQLYTRLWVKHGK